MAPDLSATLPLELRQAITRAGAAVTTTPEHNLAPVYRRVIYAIMGHTDPASPRGWLALFTAQRVAGFWQAAGRRLLLGDPLITVEALLRGRLSPFAGRQAAQEAWRQLVVAQPSQPTDARALD